MTDCNISIQLIYEPANPRGGVLPVARVVSPHLAAAVARLAIEQAEAHALAVSEYNDVLGKELREEAEKLCQLLMRLVPGFAPTEKPEATAVFVQ